MNYRCSALLLSSLGPAIFANAQIEPTIDLRSLQAKAAKAHTESRTTVDLGTVKGIPPDTSSFNNAIDYFNLFLVKPVKSESVIENGRDIVTWFTVDIEAKLSIVPGTPLAPSLDQLLSSKPTSLLQRNQLFVLHHGGSVVVDGVRFTKQVADFPFLQLSKEYLCFLSISEDGNVAIVPLGGQGVYEVTDSEHLKSLSSRPSPLSSDIDVLTFGSLYRLRSHVTSYLARRLGTC